MRLAFLSFVLPALLFGATRARADWATGWHQLGCSESAHANLSACLDAHKARQAGEVGDDARERGALAEKNALERADMADQVGKDNNKLLDDLERMRNSPAQREQLLAKPYQPPKEMRETLRELGLSTNRDLYRKAEQVQKKLQEQSQQLADYSAKKYADAAKAGTVANKLLDMKKTNLERAAGMKSHDANGAPQAAANKPAPGSPGGDGYFESNRAPTGVGRELASTKAARTSSLEKSAPVAMAVGSSRVDLQACKLEYSIVSPK